MVPEPEAASPLLIAIAGSPLSEWALRFGPAEHTSLMLMGLVAAAVLSHGDLVKGLAMVVLGLLVGIVGTDVNSGVPRYTFGIPELYDGIGFTVVAVGLFAVSEIAGNLETKKKREVFTHKITGLMPTVKDLRDSSWPVVRGTALGAFFGLLPGAGPALPTFATYMLEKKLARDPSRFGHGAIEGGAAPEAANNAAAQTAFIPTLTLGIPGTATMAILMGAMTIQGITPGPQVMVTHPDLFWGVIASMWIGNLMLVILNLPLVGIWVRLLRVPYRWLFPSIIMFCAIGNYSVSNNPVDVYLCAAVGVLGYLFVKLGCEPAPFVLGYVLGPLIEEYPRRALLLSRGDASVFFTRPISLAFMIGTVLILVLMTAPALRGRGDRRD